MGEASPGDAELVRRARAGERSAFARLVERHQDYIYNSVYHLVGSETDAEDLAQETFVKAFSHLDGFRGEARFTTWLYGIMLNTVRSHWRRAGRRKMASLDGQEDGPGIDPAAAEPGPARNAVRSEQVQAVRAAIAELDEPMREVLVLRDIRGLTYAELGEALELPDGTVKSRLYRARQQLKDKLEPYWAAQR